MSRLTHRPEGPSVNLRRKMDFPSVRPMTFYQSQLSGRSDYYFLKNIRLRSVFGFGEKHCGGISNLPSCDEGPSLKIFSFISVFHSGSRQLPKPSGRFF